MRKKGRPAGEGDRGNKICKGTSKAGRSRLLRLPLAASPEKEADRYDFALERTVKEILHSAAIGGRMHCHIQWSMELSISLLSGRSPLVTHVSTRLASGSRPFPTGSY